jgi:AraC-like DNA-binding protein
MPGTYFRLILRQIGTTESRRVAVLQGTGVDGEDVETPGAEVTLEQQLRQVRNVGRLMPSGWGLAFGALCQATAHGSLGFGALSAPKLGTALELVARFAHVRNPSIGASFHRGEDFGRLVVRPQCELLDEEREPLIEIFLLSLQAIVESVLDHRLDRGRVEIAGHPNHARLYPRFFHQEVHFGARESALVVPLEWLEQPCSLADPEMYEVSLQRLQMGADRLRDDAQLAPRVAQLLSASGDAGLPIAEAARRLGCSPRTLIRRLAGADLTYRELRDAHRCRRAEALLRSTLPLAEVAWRLGYQDASNLTRACHRWFGTPAGEVRARLRSGAAHSTVLRSAVG